jgi:hypothetical protein
MGGVLAGTRGKIHPPTRSLEAGYAEWDRKGDLSCLERRTVRKRGAEPGAPRQAHCLVSEAKVGRGLGKNPALAERSVLIVSTLEDRHAIPFEP